MRILIVTSRLPFPPSWGAATRDYQLVRHLARRQFVTLLCYAQPEEREAAEQLRGELDEVRLVPFTTSSSWSRRLSQARTLLSPRPFATAEGRVSAMQQALDRIMVREMFDVVQVESVRMNDVRTPPGVLRIIDEHNVEYELLARMALGERSLARRGFNALEERKLRRVETRAWRAAGGCLVTSPREEVIVRAEAPATPTLTVPNGVDTEYFQPAPEPPDPDSIVFTGNLNYRPNVDAVHLLVEQVFPEIIRRRPGCTLTIVGGGGEGLRRLERPGVVFTGWVPDLRPYLRRAAVVAVPLRIGGGTRLKIVEAFASGKAVVSTRLGVEGIDAVPGRHLLVADDPVNFAGQVVALLEDPARGRRVGAAAAALARSQYSWAQVAAALEAFYEELTSSRLPAGR